MLFREVSFVELTNHNSFRYKFLGGKEYADNVTVWISCQGNVIIFRVLKETGRVSVTTHTSMNDGYQTSTFCRPMAYGEKGSTTSKVHNVVRWVFDPNPISIPVGWTVTVDHIGQNRDDPRLCATRYATAEMQARNRYKHSTKKSAGKKRKADDESDDSD